MVMTLRARVSFKYLIEKLSQDVAQTSAHEWDLDAKRELTQLLRFQLGTSFMVARFAKDPTQD